ncbi:prepilin-type N-terminal cleavage/methylation domain-containing protein [Rubritalea profundi]|uniref:Prepilin-type N-terminal cleavage/methylation domain-containing protein n=1 Tax=Rubritalea profundi TaxID=1658618 RepID=A0A2S7TZ73_9BACT|nr:prepilin-type N-terminal cleavage/methylation domain-containing protein [Rubritalea profundi]PQJ27557.1 hypothetical protein BSZ32_02975 [Rubritalea profundi]
MKLFIIPKRRKGYTLIELSVVLVLVVLIASTLVSMLSQQVQFYTWWNTQRFIAEEAPLANNIVVRLFAKADTFRTVTNAGATSMQLGFVQNNGTTLYGVISYNAGTSSLQYSYDGGAAWNIASGLSAANFNTVGNTLQFTLTGPYGGQVTYAATPAL